MEVGVENCCRIPEIQRPVDPVGILQTLARERHPEAEYVQIRVREELDVPAYAKVVG